MFIMRFLFLKSNLPGSHYNRQRITNWVHEQYMFNIFRAIHTYQNTILNNFALVIYDDYDSNPQHLVNQ